MINYFLKKEGFFKTFVVLALRGRKIEKNRDGEIKCGIARPDPIYLCFKSLEGVLTG